MLALPQDIADAVRQVVSGWRAPDGWVPADPAPRTPPACCDPDPPLPEDDGWDVSPALERSLAAYIQPDDSTRHAEG